MQAAVFIVQPSVLETGLLAAAKFSIISLGTQFVDSFSYLFISLPHTHREYAIPSKMDGSRIGKQYCIV